MPHELPLASGTEPLEKPPASVLLSRATRLRCPRCGGGKLFHGWFRMYERCPNCKFKYERAPGYFLGSAYVNYGLTALIITSIYIPLRFIAGVEGKYMLWPLGIFCVIFPLFFFRYARAWWLAMDCHFDKEVYEEEHPKGE